MGQVVVYKLANGSDPKSDTFTVQERADGMREIGRRVERKLEKARKKYARRIAGVLKFFIDDAGFEVRYEFTDGDGDHRYRLKPDPDERLGYELLSWPSGVETVIGYLDINVRKDNSDANNLHMMNITVPRRLDVGSNDIFGYVSNLITDLPLAGGATAQANYLKGAITFQRCL